MTEFEKIAEVQLHNVCWWVFCGSGSSRRTRDRFVIAAGHVKVGQAMEIFLDTRVEEKSELPAGAPLFVRWGRRRKH
ncbi:hypothetical protein [Roseimaritima ulvae]|uniref:Uncharacterized protein n=1 Tax=Roseimaritima ulvae TaxID=980254 RepID=A0A5B9QP38_9BACT|nr:hypothetical protein [Roseimaritima ulvae]QEG40857.1 hypothetical protein UC8_28750 [Roseimaritima ulvae]